MTLALRYHSSASGLRSFKANSRLNAGRPHILARRMPIVKASTEKKDFKGTITTGLGITGVIAPLLLDNSAAFAINREYGILEGQIFSLMHPAIMFFLFGASVYAGYLGFQWRRTRELANEIKALKSQRAPATVGADGQPVQAPPSPLDSQIAQLETERKELIGQKLNEKHNNWGSLLLGLGVLISISGGLNTFLRTGKLFPGPHLYAGAAITVLWALAAALVPSMQKGNETARSLHIAFNTLNILLFAWQIPTGLEIVGKVLQFTTLP